ncbi:hypothetical protein BDV32DRAFT_151613 [Aspergillus pseudonomiae]|uniref:Uncharacterized protein n=1 Tax=Aspergillus pseudonomiae TaxID=1506151 RepID=A0A5N7DCJ4_9EURO|nr:uncharacterized protein BDV37DRAFT_283227 [Aspergillus pseudonomiae]KAB8258281.1 hypothetical protein BDV32DRAFT_151613 [Aspergillus pseudonomiae]KAE8403964.1 hypothetical protein BDV37DRAFT_283227 [Aspergillus pseudonomiae]
MLHVIFQSKELQVLIVYDRTSIWVLMFGISHDDPVEKFTEEYCRSAMDKAIGEQTDYEIANICAWEAPLRISDFYGSPAFPNAFVLGDVTHSFPNTGGLGANTDSQSPPMYIHNLGWKIHAVKEG